MAEKILIIDDDPDILKVLKANLELYGYQVCCVQKGQEALDQISREPPDLIILDLILPDIDGIQLCQILRKEITVPIIMLTARDRVSDKVLGLEVGADDYVVKPFETLELVARIKACLRRSKKIIAPEIIIDHLQIDFIRRTVHSNGELIELTPKEFDLLKLLISYRGEALTRNFIRQQIWKETPIYEWSRTIDVHIQHLRAKLEKDPSQPEYILTIPGIGYKFKE
jgi:DNA-binding response OmpR family regulator